MSIEVNHSVTARLERGATLADLAALVEAADQAGISRSAGLTIEKYIGHQLDRDPSYATIEHRIVCRTVTPWEPVQTSSMESAPAGEMQ